MEKFKIGLKNADGFRQAALPCLTGSESGLAAWPVKLEFHSSPNHLPAA